MKHAGRPPSGPRGQVGAAAEDAAADHLAAQGWSILARNLRLAGVEVDIVAVEPGRPPVVVIIEVRSRSSSRYGAAVESVDGRKVARLYRASLWLRREEHPPVDLGGLRGTIPRVDLITLRRHAAGGWVVDDHLRGLMPP